MIFLKKFNNRLVWLFMWDFRNRLAGIKKWARLPAGPGAGKSISGEKPEFAL